MTLTTTMDTATSVTTQAVRRRSALGPRYLRFWRRMPRELGYLAVTAVIGALSLAVFNAFGSIGAGLLALVVGVAMFALLLLATRYLGRFELYRLRLARLPEIPAPSWPRPFRTGKGFFRTLGDVFSNPHSWLYYLHSGLLNPVLAAITAAIWLPWSVFAIGLTLTPAWVAIHPLAGRVGEVYLAGRPSVPINGWSLGEIVTYRLSGSLDGVGWVVVGFTAIGLGLLAAFPVVTRGLSMAHWGLGRLLLARFRSEQLGAEIERVGAAQRAAIAAEDNALRRLERDIHDGPQQRLLRLQMELSAAERQLRAADGDTATIDSLLEARTLAQETLDELRALAQGFAPPLLQDRGLQAALEALARRSAVPLEADIRVAEPLPSPVERSAYFVAAELTSNAIKHAAARRILLRVVTESSSAGEQVLRISVSDDGVGGAVTVPQHGLAGAAERLAGLGGELRVSSPVGGPTEVTATVPLGAASTGTATSPVPRR